MKFNKLVKVVLIGCGMLMLAGCAHKRSMNGTGDASMNGGMGMEDGGAQTSGVGQSSGFGSTGPAQSLQQRTFYFDYDRSDIREEDKPAIMGNADYLIAHPHARVTVEGHTDPRGSREYNVALGERRANAVAEMLRSKGVNGNQIRVVSYGAERLAVPGHTEDDYHLDRRAVIVYTQK